jgi:hypothetical protein
LAIGLDPSVSVGCLTQMFSVNAVVLTFASVVWPKLDEPLKTPELFRLVLGPLLAPLNVTLVCAELLPPIGSVATLVVV